MWSYPFLVSQLFGVPLSLHLVTFLMFFNLVVVKTTRCFGRKFEEIADCVNDEHVSVVKHTSMPIVVRKNNTKSPVWLPFGLSYRQSSDYW